MTYGKILIQVPIWHLYSLTLEALYLIGFFSFMPKMGLAWFHSQLKALRRWKRRYGDHKWYIIFRNPKIIKVWGIPRESEKVFYVRSKQEP